MAGGLRGVPAAALSGGLRWRLVDARAQVVGRLAARLAVTLQVRWRRAGLSSWQQQHQSGSGTSPALLPRPPPPRPPSAPGRPGA